MIWKYLSVAALAAVKYMLVPIYGKSAIHLSFWETYLSMLIGGVLASFLFFKFTYRLLERSRNKRKMRREQALAMGFEYFEPKKFTRTNKLVVQVRRRLGFFACTFFFPFFLSVPVGTIIATKFYGKNVFFFPLVALGLAVNGLISTIIVYAI
jgi:hypothetical protein